MTEGTKKLETRVKKMEERTYGQRLAFMKGHVTHLQCGNNDRYKSCKKFFLLRTREKK